MTDMIIKTVLQPPIEIKTVLTVGQGLTGAKGRETGAAGCVKA